MQKTRIAIGTALALALGAATFGIVGSADAQMYGYGMMGPGYGPGMMHGHGYGGRGPGWFRNQGNLNISTDDAKNYFERWLAIQGNSRLKVGDVKEKDSDTITVDIVTKNNSLVQRFEVNRHNGSFQQVGG